jgi:hypothetical protein
LPRCPSRSLQAARKTAAIPVIGSCGTRPTLLRRQADGADHVERGYSGQDSERPKRSFHPPRRLIARTRHDRRYVERVAGDPRPHPWRSIVAGQERHAVGDLADAISLHEAVMAIQARSAANRSRRGKLNGAERD